MNFNIYSRLNKRAELIPNKSKFINQILKIYLIINIYYFCIIFIFTKKILNLRIEIVI